MTTKLPSLPRPTPQSCRVCGCTWDRACAVGCGWAEADLCTVCKELQAMVLKHCRQQRRLPEILVHVALHLEQLDDVDALRARRTVRDLVRIGELVRDGKTYKTAGRPKKRKAA